MSEKDNLVENYKGLRIRVEPYMKNRFSWRVNKKKGIATTLDNAVIQAKRYIVSILDKSEE